MAAPLTASPSGGLKIGELAQRSGLPVKTLRYCEDLGLLPATGRTPGGYRLFAEPSLQRLEFIRRLKNLGLSLEEIRECLAAHDAGQLPCADVQLQQLRGELQELLANWRSEPQPQDTVICPNLRV